MINIFIAAVLLLSSFANCLTLRSEAESCKTVVLHGKQQANGPVVIDASPLTPFMYSRLASGNYTAWEQWYFDTISSNGDSNVAMTFFRDPSYNVPSSSLWVMHDAVWANGTRSSTITYVESAKITECRGYTYGLWSSPSQKSFFSFNVTADMKYGTYTVSTPKTKGTMEITSLAPARYQDSSLWPNALASTQFAPMLWWTEVMPAGNTMSNFNIGGSPISFSGYGGVDYYAGSYTWDFICEEWHWMRGVVGPYTVIFYKFTSAIDHETYTSAVLIKGGVTLFKTQNSEEVLKKNPKASYAKLSMLYGGKVTAPIGVQNTGFGVDLVEGASDSGLGRAWHFDLTHANVGFSTDASVNNQYTRFADKAYGGQVGTFYYNGVFNSEQAKIKKISPIN